MEKLTSLFVVLAFLISSFVFSAYRPSRIAGGNALQTQNFSRTAVRMQTWNGVHHSYNNSQCERNWYSGGPIYNPYPFNDYPNYFNDDFNDGFFINSFPYDYVIVSSPYTNITLPAPSAASVEFTVAATPPSTNKNDTTVTINIPDSGGLYTPVVLKVVKGGYIGPQGEFYSGHPTVEELKALYGK